MADHINTGKLGEKLAVNYLISKTYKILETNWRFGHKEIDIIAQNDNEIVFIEVKTRKSSYYEKPHEAVGLKKQEFLIEAAEAFLEEKEMDVEIRFDIISILLDKKEPQIEHIENAFTPLF